MPETFDEAQFRLGFKAGVEYAKENYARRSAIKEAKQKQKANPKSHFSNTDTIIKPEDTLESELETYDPTGLSDMRAEHKLISQHLSRPLRVDRRREEFRTLPRWTNAVALEDWIDEYLEKFHAWMGELGYTADQIRRDHMVHLVGAIYDNLPGALRCGMKMNLDDRKGGRGGGDGGGGGGGEVENGGGGGGGSGGGEDVSFSEAMRGVYNRYRIECRAGNTEVLPHRPSSTKHYNKSKPRTTSSTSTLPTPRHTPASTPPGGPAASSSSSTSKSYSNSNSMSTPTMPKSIMPIPTSPASAYDHHHPAQQQQLPPPPPTRPEKRKWDVVAVRQQDCMYGDDCRSKSWCAKAHPSDPCFMHPTRKHTNRECFTRKKFPSYDSNT